jgi:hypothetical protein
MTRLNRAGAARSLILTCTVVGTLLAAATPLRSAPPQARERHAFVSVLDDSHRPVTGLTADDFVVREDGIAREVLRVSAAGPPSHVVLLIDDSQATRALTVDLRLGLETLVERIAAEAPAPAMRLATFGDRPTTRVEFTNSAALILDGVERLFPRPGAGATLLEALIETSRDLRSRQAERPVIVVFVAEAGPEYSDDRHTRVADVLREAGAALWAIPLQDPRGQSLSDPGRERSLVLGDVTRESGGLSLPVLSREGIARGFETVAAALTSQYDVTYGRPDALIPPTRIAVSTRTSSHTVIASQWVRP